MQDFDRNARAACPGGKVHGTADIGRQQQWCLGGAQGFDLLRQQRIRRVGFFEHVAPRRAATDGVPGQRDELEFGHRAQQFVRSPHVPDDIPQAARLMDRRTPIQWPQRSIVRPSAVGKGIGKEARDLDDRWPDTGPCTTGFIDPRAAIVEQGGAAAREKKFLRNKFRN